jgi:Ca2+-transporting ATPase
LVNVHEVVVGDVMLLEAGDVIPVDGLLIDGYNVLCDESSATGESELVPKISAELALRRFKAGSPDHVELDPFILSGAKVRDGVGTFLVTAVGVNSYYGRTLMCRDPSWRI